MYHRTDSPRLSRRHTEALPGRDPEEAARRALERVRRTLTAFRPGIAFDPAALRSALADGFPQAESEAERLFALGWLHWLEGTFPEAEAPLVKAVDLNRSSNAVAPLAEAAYWLARARIRLDRLDAVTEFEALLRHLGGSPQATVWFVDLLWRMGWVGRAEQVWMSVRGNKRVAACPDAPLLEARLLLHRGDSPGAIKVLVEAQPTNGVLWVERQLLLAWAEVARGRRDKALELLRRVEELPYPQATLALWKGAVEKPVVLAEGDRVPIVLRDLDRGYRALLAGGDAEAVEAFGKAQLQTPTSPFARYALARLGRDSFATLLSAQPGLFVAVRCRVWMALERFRLRQGTPSEWLETLQRETRLGFVSGRTTDHFRRLAQMLRQEPDADELRLVVESVAEAESVERRNVLRAALEGADRLPSDQAKLLLMTWAKLEWLEAADELRSRIGRHLLRLMIAETNDVGLLNGHPLLQPAAELWRATDETAPDDAWRERVVGLKSSPYLRPLAQTLLLYEAARRGDFAAVTARMEEAEAWRGFPTAPPTFVLRTVEAIVNAQPANAGLRRAVARWLQIWDVSALGHAGAALAAFAGLTSVPASRAEIPAGVQHAAWLLHQAAKAMGREDFGEALACVRRAGAVDPEWATVPNSAAVREALPELERRAQAQALAVALDDGVPIADRLLVDLIDLLRALPGCAIVAAAERGDGTAVGAGLVALLSHPEMAPRLAHHLALIELRSAQSLEDRGETTAAEPHWRRAWTAWLRFFAAPQQVGAGLIFDFLLGLHRRRIGDLMARSAVDAARKHWTLVLDLPALAAKQNESLGTDLAGRVERFREELASEYLVTTREAMRYGDIPEGWRADYEKGLAHLRRLLSLDRENVRLLTAVMEVCGDWFLDLYNSAEHHRLAEQVARFVPFALQLARLTEARPGDLAALAALSEFAKFRGFVASDRAEKAARYREALRYNPANENARALLEELGEKE